MRLKRTLKRQANRSSPSYLSPVSPEGERRFVSLPKGLIGKELHNSSEDSQDSDKLVLPSLDKILTLGRISKLLLLSLNRIFRGR